jgi:hypothetical protein
VPSDLNQHYACGRSQDQFIVFVAFDHEAAVAPHGFGNVSANRSWYSKLGIAVKHTENKICVVAGCARVPQPKASDAIGVHVLGGAFKFSENGEVMARINCERVVNFEQCGFIALND